MMIIEKRTLKEGGISKMSRRYGEPNTKIPSDVMNIVEDLGENVRAISDTMVQHYCGELNSLMLDIRHTIDNNGVTDSYLEDTILSLANILYFTGSAQEDLGIKEDTCKAIRQEVYLKAKDSGKGTVADKTARAELAAQSETLTLAIYSRTYKKVKLKVEAGYEMLNSLKKIMNRRISELELSNSRYIGKSNGIPESN